MLAIFHKSVAEGPEALESPQSENVCALKDGVLVQHFSSMYPDSVIHNLGSSVVFAYSGQSQSSLYFPKSFAVVDDIFCLFQGSLNNMEHLKEQYGLKMPINPPIIAIEAYRTLRDRGPIPADQVVKDFDGTFWFFLYDRSSKMTFIASNSNRSIPFHWGKDSEGHLVLSDDFDIMKKGCGYSFAVFPTGCFFTSTRGLRSYQHPLHEVRAVPRVDAAGDVYGALFVVDLEVEKPTSGMPRVASDANWSTEF